MRLAVERAEAENLFETLANNSPVGLCIIQDGRFCYINPTFQSNTGYTEDELLGRDSLELIIPEDREIARENAVKMLKGESTLPHQFRVTHKDGSIHWVVESVASIQYHGRRATMGTFVDITEHKQTEEKLKLLSSVTQQVSDAIIITGADFNITYVNRAAQDLFGYSPEEMLGKHMGAFNAKPPPKSLAQEIEQTVSSGKLWVGTLAKKRKDGSTFLGECHITPLYDTDGKISSYIDVLRDITKHKQADEALQTEKNKLQSLIDTIEDHITIRDRDYNLIYMAEHVKKLWGDHTGEKCYRVLEGQDKVCDGCPAEKAFRDGKSHTSERKTVTPSGEVLIWETRANLIRDAEGKIVACLEIARNITERKQMVEALQVEKNKLQSVIDAMADALTIQDREYNIIFQNELSKIIYGDHPGEKCYRIYAGREKTCDRCPVEEAFKDGKPRTVERRKVMPSGEIAFWELTANPIRDAKGEIVSCLEIGRDITERKKAEQALADEATQRHILVDQSIDGIVVLDGNGKVYEANQRFAEMLGYTLEEVHELHMWDWDTQWTREQLLKMVRSVDETGDHIKTYHRRKDGTVYDVEISSNGAMYKGQKLVFCVCRDVTERKQAEEALQAEKNKLQSVIGAMEDDLTIQDTEYNIIFQNEPSRIASGGDQLGEKCYRVYEGREKICEGCPVEKAFKDGESHTAEREVTLPSGKVTFWENTANPIRDAGGKIISCLELNRDITERKKQEQALADELTRRRLLVDQSLDGIVVLDEDAKVCEANQRFAEMLGYTLEEVCELHTWDWDKNFPPEQILEMGRNVDEKGLHLETKHTRKDGSVIDVDISISGIMYGGQKLIFCIGRDITERKKMEEKVQHLNLVLRAIRNINQLIARGTDRDGLLKGVCDTFVKTRGYYSAWIALLDESGKLVTAAEAGLGKSFLQVMERLKRGELTHCGCKVLEKPGVLVIKDVSSECEDCPVAKEDTGRGATSIRLEYGGKVYGLMTVSIPPDRATEKEEHDLFEEIAGDIAFALYSMEQEQERKRVQKALRNSEEKLWKIFESATDGIAVIDLKGIITEVNQRTVEMHGFSSKDELRGKGAFELVAPRDRERIAAGMKKTIKQEAIRGVEYTLLRADGSEFPGELSTSVLKDASDNVVGHITIVRDISERKKMDEALKLAAEEWRKTFDSISDAISIHDRDHKILRANKAFADIFHKKPHQIIGKYCYELHSGGKPISGCPHKQTLATKQPATAEFYESHLGKYLLESTSPIFDEKGEVVGTVHITRDVTEQKQQNERLMMADRLASIGELAAGTAHELNNPLTSVIGFSQLLMEKDIPDDIREDLKLVHNEAQRAVNVTKKLLTFARKQAPMKQLYQINNIIEDVLKLRAYEHKVNGIEVKRQLAPDLPEIMVDYSQIQQVFLNIIINAEYFMSETHNRGTLTITTKRQNGNVRISIADDGPGISKENLRRIFNPFFTTKEAGKGTGLGLSICHGIVAEHGGQIYARNQPGKGATIFIELPINSH